MKKQRHRLVDRGDDCYETSPQAVHALLRVEKIPHRIWEPCCGSGNIVQVLRDAGHQVVATDLVDYGCPDSQARIDFLMEWTAPPGVVGVITNFPNKNATAMVRHALRMVPYVASLHPISFLSAECRDNIIKSLARLHVFRERLPMMHRRGWNGPKSTSQVPFAWFVWSCEHRGPPTLDRISWRGQP